MITQTMRAARVVSARRGVLSRLQSAAEAAASHARHNSRFRDGGDGGSSGAAATGRAAAVPFSTVATSVTTATAMRTAAAARPAAPRQQRRSLSIATTAARTAAAATAEPTVAPAAAATSAFAGTPTAATAACGSAWESSGGVSGSLLPYSALQRWVSVFDPAVAVHAAHTAPASWYTEPAMYALERRSVFRSEWLHVGRVDQVPRAGDFFSGCVVGEPFIVCRDDDGVIRAHFNVCKHHAARLVPGADSDRPGDAPAGSTGNTSAFVCPYHGWTYGLDGRLRKATKMKGVTQFRAATVTLTPIQVKVMGPLIFLRFTTEPDTTGHWESVRGLHDAFAATGYENMRFVKRVTYPIRCNWKVFVDNYLDGGLHVPYAHKGLASLIEDGSYRIDVHERYSIQSAAGKTTPAASVDAKVNASGAATGAGAGAGSGGAAGDSPDRLGSAALYGFVYPNVMLNRYGAWLDTNTVYPTGPHSCAVVFDYFVDPQQLRQTIAGTGESEAQYIARCLASSDVVQREDMGLCESVQSGLNSSAYHAGRYAPAFEHPMHQFHRLLHANYSAAISAATSASASATTAATSTVASAPPPVAAAASGATNAVPAPPTRGAARALARSRQRPAPENPAAPLSVSLATAAAVPSDATPPATAAATAC